MIKLILQLFKKHSGDLSKHRLHTTKYEDQFVESYERGSKKEDSVIRDYRPTEKYKAKIKNYAQPRKSNLEENVKSSLRDLKIYGRFREVGEKEA